jgi:hypothetical protein
MAVAVAVAASKARDLFHETWKCGSCGRSFVDATSCVVHEQQCGGRFSHC